MRSRLGNQHFDPIAPLDRHANDTESRANASGRQGARVALRHHATAFGHKLCAEPTDALVGFPAFLVNLLRLFDERRANPAEPDFPMVCGGECKFLEASLESFDGPE